MTWSTRSTRAHGGDPLAVPWANTRDANALIRLLLFTGWVLEIDVRASSVSLGAGARGRIGALGWGWAPQTEVTITLRDGTVYVDSTGDVLGAIGRAVRPVPTLVELVEVHRQGAAP